MGRFADVKTPSISRIVLFIAARVTSDLRFFGWPIYGHRPILSRMQFGLQFHSAENRGLSYFPVQKRALQNTPSVGGGIREVMIRPFSVFCVIGRIAFGPHVLAKAARPTRLNSSHRCISYAVFC